MPTSSTLASMPTVTKSLITDRGGEMTALWAWILAFLTGLSADPHGMNVESPKAAAAVSVAYASFATEK